MLSIWWRSPSADSPNVINPALPADLADDGHDELPCLADVGHLLDFAHCAVELGSGGVKPKVYRRATDGLAASNPNFVPEPFCNGGSAYAINQMYPKSA